MQENLDSTSVEIVVSPQDAISGVFGVSGTQTIGSGPKPQENGDLGPCFLGCGWRRTGPREWSEPNDTVPFDNPHSLAT